MPVPSLAAATMPRPMGEASVWAQCGEQIEVKDEADRRKGTDVEGMMIGMLVRMRGEGGYSGVMND